MLITIKASNFYIWYGVIFYEIPARGRALFTYLNNIIKPVEAWINKSKFLNRLFTQNAANNQKADTCGVLCSIAVD